MTMPAAATALCYCAATRSLFIGLATGPISQYAVDEDLNGVKFVAGFAAHSGRVTAIAYDRGTKMIFSCGRDKSIFQQNVETARVVAGTKTSGWCSCMAYDPASRMVFVGDYTGAVHVLKVGDGNLEKVTKLEGHTASVRSLEWSASRKLLFSGGFDKTVICWDIGGAKGVSYELSGHTGKVKGLAFLVGEDKLLSAGDDGRLVAWDMSVERKENPEWKEAENCELCSAPFFWNVKQMWANGAVSLNRQHHCRICGKAICNACSLACAPYPPMGYELPVRQCDSCVKGVEEEELTPLCLAFPLGHKVMRMRFESSTDTIVTCGDDHVVRGWYADSVLHPERAAEKRAQREAKAKSAPTVVAPGTADAQQLQKDEEDGGQEDLLSMLSE